MNPRLLDKFETYVSQLATQGKASHKQKYSSNKLIPDIRVATAGQRPVAAHFILPRPPLFPRTALSASGYASDHCSPRYEPYHQVRADLLE